MNERKIGVILSYISMGIATLIGLIITPFIIKMIGKEEYGVFNIVGAFVSYLSVISSSFAGTVVRYITRYRVSGDKDKEQAFLGFVTIVNVVLSVVIGLIGLYFWSRIPQIFGNSLTAQEIILADKMFLVLLINIVLTIGLNTFNGILVAYERFKLIKILEIISEILSTIIIIALLLGGHKALMMVVVTSVCNIMVLLVKMFYSFRNLHVKICFSLIDRSLAIEIFFYVLSILIVAIAEQMYWKFGNIIIGMYIGAAAVSVFSIGMSFHKYFMRFSTTISNVLVPKIMMEVDAGSNSVELTNSLLRISRIQALILSSVLSGLIIFGRDFIILWVGDTFMDAYYIMLLTLIPLSIELSGNIRNVVLQAKNLYWYRSVILILSAIISVVLSIILLKNFGIIGVAASTGLGVILGYIATNYLLKKMVGFDFIFYLRGLTKGIIPSMCITLLLGVIFTFFPKETWFSFFLQITLFSVIIIFNLWKFAMNDYEKGLVLNLIKRKK